MPPNQNRNAPGKGGEEGEKRTKVGHSLTQPQPGIGGNVYTWMAGKAFPPPFSRSLDPRPFSTCFDFCPGESDNIWDPISNCSLPLLPPTPIPYHSPHLLSLPGVAVTRNSIEKKRKTQWAGRMLESSVGRRGDIFPPFSHRSVNCRWRRRQPRRQCACGGRHILYDGNRRLFGQKRKTRSCFRY